MKKAAAVLIVAALAVLAGCLDSEQEFTLNPDGSGKVKIKATSVSKLADFAFKATPEDALRSSVIDTLEKSKGVDAWSDLSAKLTDDGKTVFTATAYFKDISKLRLNILGTESDFPHLSVKKEADGSLSVEATPEKKEADEAPPPAEKPSEEELKELIKVERAKYRGMSRLMETFLKDLRLKARVILPGAVGETKNFKKVGDNAVEVTLDGKVVMKALDDLMMDDAFMKRQLSQGRAFMKSGPPSDDEAMQKIFGEKGPVRAVAKGPLKPAFDYEAEAAGPRAGHLDLLRKHGAKVPLPPPAAGEGFKKIIVGGVKLVHVADIEKGIAPLGESRPGITFGVIGQFSGPVIAMKEGELKKAVSDDGVNLLPKEEYERKISFPRLNQDKTSVDFEVRLALPPAKAAGIKEISGTMQYVLAGKPKEVELGFGKLEKGAKGKALEAVITELGENEFQKDHQTLTIKLAIERDSVESITFYDASGKALEPFQGGDMSSGAETTLSYTLQGKFPAKGKAVAKIYQDLKVYEIPFVIKDVDLLGRPQQK